LLVPYLAGRVVLIELILDSIQRWQVFGADTACAGYLGTLISVLFGQTIALLTSIQVNLSHSSVFGT
jgi:hypothetical protein